MITEDSVSDNNEKKPLQEEVSQENSSENTTEVSTDSLAEVSAENLAEETVYENSENSSEEILQEKPEHQADVDTQQSTETAPEEKVLSEIDPEKADEGEPHHDHHEEEALESVAHLTLPEILKEMESIINKEDAGAHFRTFNHLKEQANHFIHDETEDQKIEFIAAGNAAEDFHFQHPDLS